MNTASIVPFWNRLPDISLYPFRGAAMFTTAVLAGGIILLGWVPLVRPLLWIAAFKFAFETLERTANGYMKAADVPSGMDNSLVWRYLLLQVLTIAIPVALSVLLSPTAGIACLVAIVLVQPAAIMGLVLSGSLRRGLNPGLWIEVMSRVGWPYLALVGLLLVMQLSAANASESLSSVLPWYLASAVATVFSLWSLFATFHLMGYMIYQYHEALDFEPSSLHNTPLRPFDRDAELTDLASQRVQQGDVQGAMQLLRAEIRSRAVSADAQELYRRLLRQCDDRKELLEHGRSFLHLLMVEKQEKRALALAHECLQLDPKFTAPLVEQNAELAKRASFAGQSALAVSLLLAAISHADSHSDKPSWALQAADLMTRQSGREAEARALLIRAKSECRDENVLSRIDAQLAGIPA